MTLSVWRRKFVEATQKTNEGRARLKHTEQSKAVYLTYMQTTP